MCREDSNLGGLYCEDQLAATAGSSLKLKPCGVFVLGAETSAAVNGLITQAVIRKLTTTRTNSVTLKLAKEPNEEIKEVS